MSGQPAYIFGDPRAWADVEERWVMCEHNDECDFEGYAEVEWVDRGSAIWTCPKCDRQSTYEID